MCKATLKLSEYVGETDFFEIELERQKKIKTEEKAKAKIIKLNKGINYLNYNNLSSTMIW